MTPASSLLDKFVEDYQYKFKQSYPVNRRTAIAAFKKLLSWSDESEVETMVDLMVNDWDSLRSALGLKGTPSITFLCSAKAFKALRDYANGSHSVSTKNRVTVDSSPIVGW